MGRGSILKVQLYVTQIIFQLQSICVELINTGFQFCLTSIPHETQLQPIHTRQPLNINLDNNM